MAGSITQMEYTILSSLVQREEFTRAVIPHLKVSYFESMDSQAIFECVQRYFESYKSLPSKEALAIEVSKSKSFNQAQFSSIISTIDNIFNTSLLDPSKHSIKWLIDSTEDWCKERSILSAIFECIEITKGERKDKDKDSLVEIIKQAVSVHFDKNVGHDYLEDVQRRYEFYSKVENRIPFDLDYFNKITGGGITRKTLNVILAGTNAGKSMFMCHMAGNYIQQGLNVLYITCEMAEERIAERIDANLMNVPINDLRLMNEMSYHSAMSKIKSKCAGKLIIREYPTASANVNHFRQLMEELSVKKNFKPDVVMVDYINICVSSRFKQIGNNNSYTIVKAIAEELRGFAGEFNVALWTATQTNREGFDSTDPSLTNTADSFGLPYTADLMFALVVTEELNRMGQVMVKQLKNRYNDATLHTKALLGVNRSKMQFFDVSQTPLSATPEIVQRDEDDAEFYGAGYGLEDKLQQARNSKFDKFKF